MKEAVHVAVCQIGANWLDPPANRRKIEQWVSRAVADSEAKLDLILFPELVTSGYVRGRDRQFAGRYYALAEPLFGETVTLLHDLCQRYDLHIIAGMIRSHPRISHTIYNTAVLVGPDGLIGHQDKTHIPAEENHYFVPGHELKVIATPLGNIGMVICYDVVYPEVCRIMALRGAEIITVLFAGPTSPSIPSNRLCMLASVRANENRNYVLACKLVGEEGDLTYYGGSAIASPTGELLACAAGRDEELILYGTLYDETVRIERAYSPTFRDRRPDLYAPLAATLEELA